MPEVTVTLTQEDAERARRAVLTRLAEALYFAADEVRGLAEKADIEAGVDAGDARDAVTQALRDVATMDRLGWPGDA